MKLRTLPRQTEQALASQLATEATDPSFKLMTTLRWDKRLVELTRRIPIAMESSLHDDFFMARLHYHRLKYGAKLLQWPEITYAPFSEALDKAIADTDSPAKVRVTLDSKGNIETTAMPATERDNLFSGLSDRPLETESNDPLYDVVIDSQETPASLFTMIKNNKRQVYDQVRARNQIEGNREALLVNEKGEITEGTVTSVAFHIDGEWVTPKLDGGMCGVMRSFLLELNFIKEGTIKAADVQDGAEVLLFNGVIGVCKGIVHTQKNPSITH